MTIYIVMKMHGVTLEWVPVKAFLIENDANVFISKQPDPINFSMSEVEYVE